MKVKNSLAALKLSPLVKLASFVLLPLAAVLRFVQVYTLVDASTGFYTKSSPLTWAVNVLMIGGAAAIAVCCYLSKDAESLQPLPYKNTGMFVLALLFGVVLLLNTATCLSGLSSAVAGLGFRTVKELMSSGALPLLFQSFFALLSGIYFIFVAVSYKKGNLFAAKHRFLALAPTAWIAARLLHLFVRKIAFTRVSDLFFELLACVCMILFFLAFAQTASGIYSTGMSWRLVGFGLPAAVLTIAVQLPRFVLLFIDSGSHINENHPFSLADICFGVFALALCFVLLRKPAGEQPLPVSEEKETPAPDHKAAEESPSFENIPPVSYGG